MCRRRAGRRARLATREVEPKVVPLELTRAFLDQREVVAVDPVGEQQARDLHVKGPVGERQQLRRLEPGVEALSIDFLLQTRKDLVPDVQLRPASWAAFARSHSWKALQAARRIETSLIFSTGFPQMWKSFGSSRY